MEWQPIETAPKDGRPVLVNDRAVGAACVMARWVGGEKYGGWMFEDELLNDHRPSGPEPIAWLDIPPPPTL